VNRLAGRATFGAFLFSLCLGILWSSACASEHPPMDGTSQQNPPPTSIDACATPNPGCPCADVGAVGECGKVELKLGTYVACSMGKMTCTGAQKWGSCVGDTVVDRVISGGNLHISALGASMVCTNNPCDPYCNEFVDDAGDVDAASLSANEAGLYIPSATANLCTCNEPAVGASLYSNLLGASKGNPGACAGNDAGTATDNCNHDYQCIGGSCTPYAVAGVNPACTQAPDYTLGLGCYDGTSWELQVCNRGYIPTPVGGHLIIAIGSGSPSTPPGACTTGAAGASWPIGPTLSPDGGSPTDTGQCDLDLSKTVIGPGQCINVSLASQCTELDGVTPLNALSRADHWAAVNPSALILPGTTPIPECDTCNNYTALEQSALPPLLSNAASCFSTTCGTVCAGGTIAGVDGGGCHTYVSGTVYDPGGNVPLPEIAVYEPNAPLSAFSPGVRCDTCATVLPPKANIVASTFSDLNGAFNIEVDATTGIPIVFQTGRWRREIMIGTDTPPLTPCAVNNITVPADCYLPGTATQPQAWPATNCKTRLPQTHVEGDIPLTAFVTGLREPFECSIAKFMGGSSEMGTGGASRIQMFQDTGTGGVVPSAKSGAAASVGVPPLSASGTGWIAKSLGPVTITNLSSLNAGGDSESVAKGPPVTVSGLAGLAPGAPATYVGGTLTIWGGLMAGNNGSFPILTVNGAGTSATITNPSAANDFLNGSAFFHWAAAEPTGPLSAGFVGGTLTLSGGATAGNNGTFAITGAPSSSSLTITNTNAAVDTRNGRSSLTWTAVGPGALTISGLSGLSASDVGSTITFTGAFSLANNGSFTIVSVPSATQATIDNPNAVGPDKNNGAISWTIAGSPVALPASTTLWGSLGSYDEIVLPCGGQGSDVATLGGPGNTAQQTDVYNWLKAGGRLFGNHWSAFGLLIPATSGGYSVPPWNATSTFQTPFQSALGSTMTGRVAPGGGITAPQQDFKTWLTTEGAYAGGGLSTPQPVSGEALVPSATSSYEWLRGSTVDGFEDDWTNDPGGNYSLIYSFDTNGSGIVPTLQGDGGAGGGCGRTIVSDMHVDVSRALENFASTDFPGACTLQPGLSPNEQAFEYLMFVLSSCAVGGQPIINSAPPPPPPAASLSPVTFMRTYQAVCPTMTMPVWQAFSWQAEIPAGTNITFQAQTAADASGSPGTFGPAVSVGTASVTTGSTWYTSPMTVDQDLKAAMPAQQSLPWLQISMTLNPSGSNSPVLEQWNLTYDCAPSE
jgi:hypothetical protein